jgi:hypothetical protein
LCQEIALGDEIRRESKEIMEKSCGEIMGSDSIDFVA